MQAYFWPLFLAGSLTKTWPQRPGIFSLTEEWKAWSPGQRISGIRVAGGSITLDWLHLP